MMKLTARFYSFLLAALTAWTMLFSIQIPVQAAASESDAVKGAVSIIIDNEGGYGTVAKNDNGALSIGVFQWHADNALALLLSIQSSYEEAGSLSDFKTLIGAKLYKEINSSPDWSSRILTESEKEKISQTISTEIGKKVQNKYAKSYVKNYFSDAKALGITNLSALVFYADIANQGGRGGARRIGRYAAMIAGSYSKVTMNELMEATMTYEPLARYASRRYRTYRSVIDLKLGRYKNKGDCQIPYASSGKANTKSGIKWLQKKLNWIFSECDLNYYKIKVTGTYDDATMEAVSRLQRMTDLEVDGDAGYATVKQIMIIHASSIIDGNPVSSYLNIDEQAKEENQLETKTYPANPSKYDVPSSPVYDGSKSSLTDVLWIQSVLSCLGYSDEKVDGVWDSETTAAVKSYQRDAGIKATGRADLKTIRSMKRAFSVTQKTVKPSASVKKGRVRLKWKKVSVASGYRVYRKYSGGKYKKIKTISKNTTTAWTDKKAGRKKVIRYCVKAFYKQGSLFKYSKSGTSVKVRTV